jgi:hypothetical protein
MARVPLFVRARLAGLNWIGTASKPHRNRIETASKPHRNRPGENTNLSVGHRPKRHQATVLSMRIAFPVYVMSGNDRNDTC